ncbi:MAG: hypothetical protein ABIO70_23745 [Pseudomonadota bacterium]
MHRAFAWLILLALAACGDKDTADTAMDDTGPGDTVPDGYVLEDGRYTLDIDEVVFNHCENDVGHGLHIHLGETTPVQITQVGTSLSATSDPGSDAEMPMIGTTDGATFDLAGDVELSVGTCVLNIHAILSGTLTADSAFDYRMDATLDIKEELSPDACSYIIGDGEEHTFPALPCDQAWTGAGALEV